MSVPASPWLIINPKFGGLHLPCGDAMVRMLPCVRRPDSKRWDGMGAWSTASALGGRENPD